MKVSVVYCTARQGGFDILMDSLENQTFKDFELIVVDELRRTPEKNIVPGRSWIHYVEPPPKKPGMYWNLSASLNAGVRAAGGDLIVLLQDYIWVPPDGIAKFVEKAQREPKSILTGVGHQYLPEGFPGRPTGEKVFHDPRVDGRAGFFLCIPVEWEANWGAFPRQAWVDIGGFDEDFDAGWGYDNVNFAERCQMAGYHIFMDISNEVLCYSHIKLFNEGAVRDAAPNNQQLWYKKYRDIAIKEAPWRLNYA